MLHSLQLPDFPLLLFHLPVVLSIRLWGRKLSSRLRVVLENCSFSAEACTCKVPTERRAITTKPSECLQETSSWPKSSPGRDQRDAGRKGETLVRAVHDMLYLLWKMHESRSSKMCEALGILFSSLLNLEDQVASSFKNALFPLRLARKTQDSATAILQLSPPGWITVIHSTRSRL